MILMLDLKEFLLKYIVDHISSYHLMTVKPSHHVKVVIMRRLAITAKNNFISNKKPN